MARKIAEKRFIATIRPMEYYTHKYGDVRRCGTCGELLPKSENMPDYALGMLYTYIECKNSDGTGRWNWASDIGPHGARQNQRRWLFERSGWLYIVLKDGRAPKEEDAYFIPWLLWIKYIEKFLIENNQKSIRRLSKGKRLGANELMEDYRLEWDKGKYLIPNKHIFWKLYNKTLQSQMEFVESKL